ncbi:uncharacterized protein LOC115888421 isoform X2 [Sitophilus oryzae]|uniref:Uncharacterized protein LOC115888421 isoform X2 n=1 Tax=Sitophilus oryzae TaxID=7048 RepID=A0A6J2YJ04_SITOR|nr:uncharacterized protein LOC115888421 isoform X2 [Sitophilus oryzae]
MKSDLNRMLDERYTNIGLCDWTTMSIDIKNVIGKLCKLLNLIYQTNLKPEYFRLSKFNKTDENVSVLWNLLFKMLNKNNILEVKGTLADLKYTRKQFYFNTTEHCGSRELLLAISFILCLCLNSQLEKHLEVSVFSENYFFDITSIENISLDFDKLNEEELQNFKKWIEGKISSNENMIYEYSHQITQMYNKLNNNLCVKANGSLTIFELLALNNQSCTEHFINNSEPVLHQLNAYTEWLKHEKIFWKWMESVLYEERKV